MGETTQIPRKRRPWLRGLAMGALILVCGMLIGGGLTLFAIGAHVHRATHHPEEIPPRAAKRVGRKLDLDKEQVRQLEEIFARRQAAIFNIRDRVAPELHLEFKRTRKEVAEILTPEQRQEWDELFDKLRKHWDPKLGITDEVKERARPTLEGQAPEPGGSGQD